MTPWWNMRWNEWRCKTLPVQPRLGLSDPWNHRLVCFYLSLNIYVPIFLILSLWAVGSLTFWCWRHGYNRACQTSWQTKHFVWGGTEKGVRIYSTKVGWKYLAMDVRPTLSTPHYLWLFYDVWPNSLMTLWPFTSDLMLFQARSLVMMSTPPYQ